MTSQNPFTERSGVGPGRPLSIFVQNVPSKVELWRCKGVPLSTLFHERVKLAFQEVNGQGRLLKRFAKRSTLHLGFVLGSMV